jgi:hypothetical protein
MCGNSKTFGQLARAFESGRGSGVITSKPEPGIEMIVLEVMNYCLPLILFNVKASTSASWSTKPPLEVLIRKADFVKFAKRVESTICLVLSFRVADTISMSDSFASFVRLSLSAYTFKQL